MLPVKKNSVKPCLVHILFSLECLVGTKTVALEWFLPAIQAVGGRISLSQVQKYKMQVERFELFREDIEDLVKLTVDKMEFSQQRR